MQDIIKDNAPVYKVCGVYLPGFAQKAFVMSANVIEARAILQPWGFVAAHAGVASTEYVLS